VTAAAVRAPVPTPSAERRLLAGIRRDGATPLDEHLARLGAVPVHDLIGELEASGLRGRGGGGFPAAAKLRSVAAHGGRPVVVVNATEAEPVSAKDRMLLRYAPHLVLDGAVAAAAALRSRSIVVVTGEHAERERFAVERALAERARRALDGRVSVRLAVAPRRFVAGEETAIVNLLNGRAAKPSFKPPLPFERGVGGAPTLVHNAETFAHGALIARFGGAWFRRAGTDDEPGTALFTLSGAVGRPGVHEAAFGTPFGALLGAGSRPPADVQAYLVGGYFGTWVPAAQAHCLLLSDASLATAGAALGAGAIVALPASSCGVIETARVARFLAGESAGQCGPCVHGLDALAALLLEIASANRHDVRPQLRARLEQVVGRGACRHPDGAARFVTSALRVFTDEFELHLTGRCSGHLAHTLPVPKAR
jgi:NADH:ubiquinone oxidoreductase subunit F (NADH-binding)